MEKAHVSLMAQRLRGSQTIQSDYTLIVLERERELMDFSLGWLSIVTNMNMQQYDKLLAGFPAVSLAHLLLLQSLILTTDSILDQNQIM